MKHWGHYSWTTLLSWLTLLHEHIIPWPNLARKSTFALGTLDYVCKTSHQAFREMLEPKWQVVLLINKAHYVSKSI